MKQGYIKISNELYVNHFDSIKVMFNDFRPTGIEFDFTDNFWYLYGSSDKFDSIIEGEILPQYDIVFTTTEKGKTIYKFKRC